MTDDLYLEELKLEEEARGLTIQRFRQDHLKGTQDSTFSETFIGSYLLKNYINPYIAAIKAWRTDALGGTAVRKPIAAKLLKDVDAGLIAFLMLKAIFNKVGVYHNEQQCSLTGLAIYGAGLIHDELRLREFEAKHPGWSNRIHDDFNQRELPRYKREEYMQQVFIKTELDWSIWSKSDMLHVGTALLSIFKDVTGDITIETFGSGKSKRDVVLASFHLLEVVEKNASHCEALFTTHFPTVIPPRDWATDTLEIGGYHSPNVSPYPLVKSSKRGYRETLRQLADNGTIDRVLTSINALQRTRWKVNTRVLDAVEFAYQHNIPCGKLPRADKKEPDPVPRMLEGLTGEDRLTEEDPRYEVWRSYRAHRFSVHEFNRRIIGKRIMASRAFHVARKMSKYEAIYFPYDLDSRGRIYPKPSGLNPQGPDYVKGILQFADAKPLGAMGVRWLAIHGANCWGQDKLPLHERENWGRDNLEFARSVARNPTEDLRWADADNPVQFLAWAFEWADAHASGNPEAFASSIHVDLDATCSGLQHFSAMLRDEVGGYHVNMIPNPVRQDVYGAVAEVTTQDIRNERDPDKSEMAKAWLEFGIDRKLTKRPVMVKPYSGTRASCTAYVGEAIDERLKEGEALPWPKDDMWCFKLYGSDKVWKAIPKVVVAADGAMQWLMKVARLVGLSQPEELRIEWTTPLGFPVHQYKFDTVSRRVETFFDGRIIRPRINEDTDRLDSRQMASSVPPSLVHSLDACHLMATVALASEAGITDYAVVHDSFGVHACDVEDFARIIRVAFVDMYENHDVLAEFLASAERFISDKYKPELPPIPEKGNLDLRGILENEFFFS